MSPRDEGASVGGAPNELWFSEDFGDLLRFYHGKRGIGMTTADDAPESLWEDAPAGWSVWDGEVYALTAEHLADEDHPASCHSLRLNPGDEWWNGVLRPATAEEVVAFFGLARRRAMSDANWDLMQDDHGAPHLYDNANDLMLSLGHLTSEEAVAVRDALNCASRSVETTSGRDAIAGVMEAVDRAAVEVNRAPYGEAVIAGMRALDDARTRLMALRRPAAPGAAPEVSGEREAYTYPQRAYPCVCKETFGHRDPIPCMGEGALFQSFYCVEKRAEPVETQGERERVADMIVAEINRVRGVGTEGWSNVVKWLRAPTDTPRATPGEETSDG